MSESECLESSRFYYIDYKDWFDELDKGYLQVPDDDTFEFACYALIFFEEVFEIIPKLCTVSCMKICKLIKDHYELRVSEKQMRVMTNILFKSYVQRNTPRSLAEIKQKIEKLKQAAKDKSSHK